MKDSGGIERKPLVGLITLLVIFAALCLTILSILSFSTAKYEKNLAQKNADAAADTPSGAADSAPRPRTPAP